MKQGVVPFLDDFLTLSWVGEEIRRVAFGRPTASSDLSDVPAKWAAHFHELPLHPAMVPFRCGSDGTAFQKEVWRALGQIPAGRVLTYGGLAARIGRPRSVRAVAAACGANRLPVLIPCHRVVGADGSLHGFSGGLEWKRKLIEAEGLPVDSDRLRIARESFIV